MKNYKVIVSILLIVLLNFSNQYQALSALPNDVAYLTPFSELDDPIACRDYIEKFIQQFSDPTPYTCQTHDCANFANDFQRLCTGVDPTVTCGVVHIFCDKAGHALNIVCHDRWCCGVEPQGKPPYIIPELCLPSEGGIPSTLPEDQCNWFCQGKKLGDCESVVVSPTILRDPTNTPSVWCYEQTIINPNIATSFANCCECCYNTWKSNPHGGWGETCEGQCHNILINRDNGGENTCSELGYDLTDHR